MPKKNYTWRYRTKIGNRIPPFLLERFGRISLETIDVVLDVGGFRFGDPWNTFYNGQSCGLMEKFYGEIKASGAKIIFLPQAFGPFKTDSARNFFLSAAKHADLLYARERVSYAHAQAVLKNTRCLRLSPDFTNLCLGVTPAGLEELAGQVCLIPNSKMITHSKEGEKYLDFMVDLAIGVQNEGKTVFLLNHEGSGDYALCQKICERLDKRPNIVDGLDAREVKGVIGGSYAVISSRYHGVVSALSQGIPCLCTSWSHKYPLLLEEYECEETLLCPSHAEAAQVLLKRFLEPASNANIRTTLTHHSTRIKEQVKTMWEEVFSLI